MNFSQQIIHYGSVHSSEKMRYVKRSHEPSLGGGEMDFRRQDQVLDLRWEGKREVNLLTTKLFPTRSEHIWR